MYLKICEICEKEFETDNPERRFCSQKCVGKYSKKNRPKSITKCSYCGNDFESDGMTKYCSEECHKKAKKKEYIKICEYCGTKFVTNNSKTRCCSRSCSSLLGAKNFNDNEEKYYLKTCKVCGKEYKAKNWRSEFCSNSCSSKYYGKKYEKEWHLKCAYCGKEIIRYSKDKPKERVFCDQVCSGKYKNKNGIGEERECKQCGALFLAKHKRHFFCCNECKTAYNYEHQEKVIVECSNCGKFVERYKSNAKKSKDFFCCKDCESEFRIKQSADTRVCENCGNEFICRKGEKLRFCSMKCQSEWQSYARCGKNSPTYKHEITDEMRVKKCEQCGKEMVGTPKEFEIKKYCSRKCTLAAINYTMTKPHKITVSILNALGIENVTELPISPKSSIDSYLIDFNLGIEVMGGYWHEDIRKYPEPIDEIQTSAKARDKTKKNRLKKLGIPTLYLWEYDLENSEKVCVDLIMEFVKKNGILDNYHSMNYSLENNFLVLNSKILIPHFEK